MNFKLLGVKVNNKVLFLSGLLSILIVVVLQKSWGYYDLKFTIGKSSFYTYVPPRFSPALLFAIPLLLIGGWIAAKRFDKKEIFSNEHYLIHGENKLDILKVSSSNLICVVASDNYVEIYYLNGIKLEKKIMRSTLKKIQEQIPELVKTHRSYLISPTHFIKWENANSITLSHMNVPISRNYKAIVKSRVAAYHQ